MASEKKQLQLIFERYDEYTSRRTIGIFTDVNELFRAAYAETCPETDLIVYELCPGRADLELKLIWNKLALQDTKFDRIVYVASGYNLQICIQRSKNFIKMQRRKNTCYQVL